MENPSSKNDKNGKSNKKLKKVNTRENDKDLISEQLISEIQNHPCIWDKSDASYKVPLKKLQAWESIGKTLNVAVPKAKKLWKNLADQFRRHLDSAWNGKSGDSFDERKFGSIRWKYFHSLMFLKDTYARRKTVSSYDNSDGSDVDALDSDNEFQETTVVLEDDEVQVVPNDSVEREAATSGSKGPQKKRKMNANSIFEKLANNSDLISKALLEKDPEDATERFLSYLGDILRSVPAASRRKCEQNVLHLVNSYAEGNPAEVVHIQDIILPQSTVQI